MTITSVGKKKTDGTEYVWTCGSSTRFKFIKIQSENYKIERGIAEIMPFKILLACSMESVDCHHVLMSDEVGNATCIDCLLEPRAKKME